MADAEEMDDSFRFADQSKELWLQGNNSAIGGGGLGGRKQQKAGCVGRCPFASIIATIITIVGTGVFCGCLYRALSITIEMFMAAFRVEVEVEWIKIVQTIIIIISAVMGGLSIILLIVGCLATGATRSQIYTGFRSRLGGRISTGFFASIVYILFILWFMVAISLTVPIIAYYMINKNCELKSPQINQSAFQNNDECLSLLTFGIKLNENKHTVCKNELIAFCNQVNEAGPLYIAAFISAALVVLGLVHYLCCLVANYAHIKDGMKLRDFEEAIKEEMELKCDYTSRKRAL